MTISFWIRIIAKCVCVVRVRKHTANNCRFRWIWHLNELDANEIYAEIRIDG